MSKEPKSPLEPYRRTAEEYYQSPEYLAQAAEIDRIVAGIHGKVIAVDAEGTLVSLNFLAYSSGPWAWNMGIGGLDRLRRPFANELLRALANSDNRIMVWTGQTEDRIRQIIATTSLNIPGKVELITRERSKAVLLASTVPQQATALYTDNDHLSKLKRDEIAKGRMKIPRLLGVDVLLDDHAFLDRSICQDLFGEEEAAKIVLVKRFQIKHFEDLDQHQKDTGLIEVVRELPTRLRAA